MSRQRFIYPEMFSSEDFLSLPFGGRLLFVGLIAFADDYGRGRGSPTVIKAEIFPTDSVRSGDLKNWCRQLETRRMIRFYVVDAATYYEIPAWDKYQKPKYKADSKIPPNQSDAGVRDKPGTIPGQTRARSGDGLGVVWCGGVGSEDRTPPTPPSLARKGGALSGLETKADLDRLKTYGQAKGEKPKANRPKRRPRSEERKQRAREAQKEKRVGSKQPPVGWMDPPMPLFTSSPPAPELLKAPAITEAMERDVRDLAPVVGHKAEAVLEGCRRERRTPEAWIRWARMEAQRLQKLSSEKQPP